MLSNTTNLTNVTNVTSTPKVAAHAQHEAHALPDTLGGAAASTDILKNIQTIYQENTPQVLTGVAAIIGGLYLTNQINGYSAVAITILAGSFIVLISNHATAGAGATTQSSKQKPPQTEITADTHTDLNPINSTPITPTQLTTREETNTSTPVNTSQTAGADAATQSTKQKPTQTEIPADTPATSASKGYVEIGPQKTATAAYPDDYDSAYIGEEPGQPSIQSKRLQTNT